MKNSISKLKNPRVYRPLSIILIVMLVLGGMLIFSMRFGKAYIDTSVIEAPITNIVPQTTGTLDEQDAYEGEQVKKGDSLAIVSGQTLTADITGVVNMANNQIGSLVGPQNPVDQIINTTDMRVAGTIDENKGLADIRPGQVVSFTVDALPGKIFWGYVDEISPSAKQTALSFSISSERPTQQFVVYARFETSKYPEIKNGMSAKMVVYTNTN